MNNYSVMGEGHRVAEGLRKAGFTDPDSKWFDYFSFNAKEIPVGWLRDTDFSLHALYDSHPFKAAVLYYEPYTLYDWHIDDRRGVTINMLIGGEGHCLFRWPMEGAKTDSMVSSVAELDYDTDTYYLFNSQIPHTVINLDTPRFLFSLEFTEDKTQLTYDQLLREYHG